MDKSNSKYVFAGPERRGPPDPFRLLVESVTDCAMLLLDEAGHVNSWNAGAENTFGYSADEILHYPLARLYGELANETWSAEHHLQLAFAHGRTSEEGQLVDKSGRAFWAAISLSALTERNGELVGFAFTAKDESKHKRASELLERRTHQLGKADEEIEHKAALFETLMRRSPAGIAFLDRETRFIQVNQTMAEINGLPADQHVGKLPSEILPEIWPKAESYVRAILDGGKAIVNVEVSGIVPSAPGKIRHWLSAYYPIRQAGGELIGVGVFSIEITDRKNAEETLRISEERQRAIVASAPAAISEVDENGNVMSWNHAAEEIFGWTQDEILGKPLPTIPQDRWQEFVDLKNRVAKGEIVRSIERTRQKKDGTTVELSIDAASIISAPDKQSILCVMTDVTEKKRAQEALREQNEILDTLNQVGKTLSAELDLEKLMQSVCNAGTRLSGAQFGAFFYNVVNDDKQAYQLYTLSGAPREAFANFAMPRKTDIFAATYDGTGIVRLADVTKDPRFGKNEPYFGMPAGHLEVRSYLAVPVVSRSGEILGGLFFGHATPNVFQERAESLVSGLATEAAIAIDNARLFQRVQNELEERSRAEDALRLSKQMLQIVIDNVPQGIFWKDRQSTFLGCNRVLYQLMGYQSESDIIGKTDLDMNFLSKEEAESFRAKDREIMETKTPQYNIVEPMTLPDGREIWLNTSKIPMHNASGAVVGILGTFEDVTERKRAEEMLRRSQANLAAAQQIAHLGSWELELGNLDDLNDNELTWSDEVFRIFGLEPGSITITNEVFFNAVHPADRQLVIDAVTSAIREKRQYSIEHRIVHTDGSIHFVHEQSDIAYDETTGAPVRMSGVVQDITERKFAEEALRESETRLRLLVENLPTGAVYIENGAVFFNRAAETITGYSRDQLKTIDDWFLALFGQNAVSARELYEADRKAGFLLPRVVTMIRRDGRIRKVEISSSQIGRIDVWVMHDVTERERLESQFRQAQKMEAVGQLAAGVAHEFNNLLTVIVGYSDILLSSLPATDQKSRASAAEIRRAGEHAADLTRQLLAFGRKQILTPVLLNLNDVLRNFQSMLLPLIGESIFLSSHLDPNLRRVKVDPSQIDQMLTNIVMNARNAMPDGGSLTLETHNVELRADYCVANADLRPGSYVVLSIADTGCGMTPEVKARIFEPFFSTKGVGEGTGLGLATVYGIVKQSEGHVEVESRLGVGTTVRIFFPAAEGMISHLATPSNLQNKNGGETVLLVEDEDSVRSLARRVLELEGYQVLEAKNGREGIRVGEAFEGDIQILVTDVVMPEVSGRLLADRIRTRRPNIKVLFMSGYTDDAVVRHGIAMDSNAFLAKPFLPQALTTRVRELLNE